MKKSMRNTPRAQLPLIGYDPGMDSASPVRLEALKLLAALTRTRFSKEDRFPDLLRDPESSAAPDWFMHVPNWFNDALDIKQTPRVVSGKTLTAWTQGGLFAFKAGDILYDTEMAYEQWATALQHIGIAVQVRCASPATAPQVSSPRMSGSVTFDTLIPDGDRNGLILSGTRTVTQDEFIRMIITGDGFEQRSQESR